LPLAWLPSALSDQLHGMVIVLNSIVWACVLTAIGWMVVFISNRKQKGRA
jgi:hypothetical protein